MHDTINKKIIPFAEFATESHTTNSISKYLLSIKGNCKTIAPFMVVDESWALINSVIQTFNGCSPLAYINWTWDVLNSDLQKQNSAHDLLNTRLFLCHTHLFKNVIKKTTDILKSLKRKNSTKIKSLFQFCFTLLQNSQYLQEFDENLELCYLIFCTHTDSKDSIKEIDFKINRRNLSILTEIHDTFILKNQSEEIKAKEGYYESCLSNSSVQSIKEGSRYSKYYRDMIKKFSGELKVVIFLNQFN